MTEHRLFKVDFYPQEWVVDTSKLAPDERGVYVQVVALIYCQRGPIDSDFQWISGACGCSSRMAKALVGKLVDKGFLTVDACGKISQKRAVQELKTKRNFLEKSAKGGRNGHENRRESTENNDLGSSPHPPPSNPSYNKHPLHQEAARGDGVLKNGMGVKKYDVMHHLNDVGIGAAKAAADGLDIYYLAPIYNEGIANGKRTVPNDPNKAFPAWVACYRKKAKP